MLAAVFACKVNTNPNLPVAIEVILPDSGRVEVTDTFRPSGQVLNGVGGPLPDSLFWSSLDTTLVVVDSATGVSYGAFVGPARLQARSGNLYSSANTPNVTVIPRLDSIRAASATRDTVFVTPVPPDTAADSLSDTLRVQAYALGGAIPTRRRVVYAMTVFPDSGPVVTFVPNDTVLTSGATAFTRVRWESGTRPDSVVVTATMRHVNGTLVQGSPVTFVVEFRP